MDPMKTLNIYSRKVVLLTGSSAIIVPALAIYGGYTLFTTLVKKTKKVFGNDPS